MRRPLTLHPDFRCAAVARIEAEAARPRPGALALRYAAAGRFADVRLPPRAASVRADGLWKHTCFEAFVRAPASSVYYEFNFSPSTQWAAYRFSGYREGMAALEIAAPRVEVASTGELFELRAELDLSGAEDLPGDGPWRLGLSAVIEEASGETSFWALAHPPGKPDFHHADCFALEVAAAERV